MKISKDWNHFPTVLPLFEVILFISFFILAILYGGYRVLLVSLDYNTESAYFDTGWSRLEKKQDVSNYEWQFYRKFFLRSFKWFIGHAFISQIVQKCIPNHRGKFHLLYGLTAVSCISGIPALLLMLIHCFLTYAIALFQRKILVWILNIALIGTLNFPPFTPWQESLFADHTDYLLFVYTCSMLSHRYMSYALETTSTQTGSLLDMLSYTFYLPLFYAGPVLTYDKFAQQMCRGKRPWTVNRIVYRMFRIVRLLIVTVLVDFIPHYLYFTAISFNYEFLKNAHLATLMGVAFCQGLYFYMKYVVIFGIGHELAALDDIDSPDTPRCVATICYYSDMWKKFDRGLYQFIKRYIYIELGGSRCGLLRQILASLCCFTYIGYWHGSTHRLFYWVFFNFLGVSGELLGTSVATLSPLNAAWSKLSLANQRRVQGVATVPLLALSLLGLHAFFNGVSVCHLVFTRFTLHGDPLSYAVTLLVLYCFVQTSLQADIWESVIEGKIIYHPVSAAAAESGPGPQGATTSARSGSAIPTLHYTNSH